jgi:hypothetical protein
MVIAKRSGDSYDEEFLIKCAVTLADKVDKVAPFDKPKKK